jgi:HlyD family secretion protein
MKKRISALLISLSLLLAGCQGNQPVPTAPAGSTSTSTAPLSASGFLEAESVTLASEVGAPILSIGAEQGQAVQMGQTLITLDDTLAQAQRAQVEAALAGAEAALTQTLAGPRMNSVAAAEADVSYAQTQYTGTLRAVADAAAIMANPPGLDVQIAQAETQVKLAEQAIQQAKSAEAPAETLRDAYPAGWPERDLYQQKMDAANAALEAAKYQYDGAVAALEQLRGMRKNPVELLAKLHTAQSQSIVAAAQVTMSQAALALTKTSTTAEDVAIAQADVQTAEANLALADEQLKHYQISTPISGVVTSKPALAGEIAVAGQPLLVVSDLSQMKLVVYVPVTQMSRVDVGASAKLTVNAYPNETFEGTVTRIGSKAEYTPSNVQSKDDRSKLVFAVTVTIPNTDMRLKAGMPADVTLGE